MSLIVYREPDEKAWQFIAGRMIPHSDQTLE
jgi:hypothetical protein